MNVLLTGSTGFLGKIILDHLKSTSVAVQTLGRGSEADFQFDLGESIPELPAFERVIHVAGKAHSYPKTAAEMQEFFRVNEKGTIHLCQALEKSGALPKQFVFISTVAVYGREFGMGIQEDEPLRGDSPYALSKIRAEEFLQAWGKQHGVKILILRLPLIAGSNPPGNLGKMIKGIKSGKYLRIGGGEAKKSMVLAQDVAQLILSVSHSEGVYNLTDGHHPTFKEMEDSIARHLGVSIPFSIPMFIANTLGKIGNVFSRFPVDGETINKITLSFTFDDSKARNDLGWQPRRVVDHLFDE